jgi:C4-dicarboxylate transporter, DctM subunit
MASLMMTQVFRDARRRNFPVEPPVRLRDMPRITWQAFPTLMMPVILLGCIYTGVTTPTEAAAIAAAYAVAVSVLIYRSLSWREGYAALLTSAKTSASIGMMIGGALVFNYVVTIENIPNSLSALLQGWDLTPLEFLILVNVILLLLGCLLEGTTILLVIVPVLIPTANALGIDLVHFGVVVVVNIMLGLVTPPYGLILFIMSNISGEPMKNIIRDCLPFLMWMLLSLALITAFPELVLWLPRQAGYAG